MTKDNLEMGIRSWMKEKFGRNQNNLETVSGANESQMDRRELLKIGGRNALALSVGTSALGAAIDYLAPKNAYAVESADASIPPWHRQIQWRDPVLGIAYNNTNNERVKVAMWSLNIGDVETFKQIMLPDYVSPTHNGLLATKTMTKQDYNGITDLGALMALKIAYNVMGHSTYFKDNLSDKGYIKPAGIGKEFAEAIKDCSSTKHLQMMFGYNPKFAQIMINKS